MPKRAHVTFQNVVIIEVRDVDGKLAQSFLRWTLENHIHPVFPATTKMGSYLGYFKAEDGQRARDWLEERNRLADEDDRACPSCRCPSCDDPDCLQVDCTACTGEYCVRHQFDPCDCDCIERHHNEGELP